LAVGHPLAVRNVMCDLVVDRIDAGAGPGVLVFQTANDIPVATLVFSRPAFGDAVDGQADANPITGDPSAVGGTIVKARVFGDIKLSGIVVAETQSARAAVDERGTRRRSSA
jgi:hypothetical protein